MDKAKLQHLKHWHDLLEDICNGLAKEGWFISGGSECFRILRNHKHLLSDHTTIKVFLNDYDNPTHIVTRFS
jgi:hypothetical protein